MLCRASDHRLLFRPGSAGGEFRGFCRSLSLDETVPVLHRSFAPPFVCLGKSGDLSICFFPVPLLLPLLLPTSTNVLGRNVRDVLAGPIYVSLLVERIGKNCAGHTDQLRRVRLQAILNVIFQTEV